LEVDRAQRSEVPLRRQQRQPHWNFTALQHGEVPARRSALHFGVVTIPAEAQAVAPAQWIVAAPFAAKLPRCAAETGAMRINHTVPTNPPRAPPWKPTAGADDGRPHSGQA